MVTTKEFELDNKIRSILIWTIMFFTYGMMGGSCPKTNAAEPGKIPVTVSIAERRDLSSKLPAFGTINYLAKADVSAEIDGLLRSVNVDEGDQVKKGQPIAVIDSALLEARLKMAAAALELAEIDLSNWEIEIRKASIRAEGLKIVMENSRDYFETQKKLFEIGGIMQSELNQAETRYQNALVDYRTALADLSALRTTSKAGRLEVEARVVKARAEIDEIQTRLEKCVIKAPISGIIASKRKWTGEKTDIGDSVIVTILQTDTVYADVELNEKNLAKVKVGQKAEVVADAYPQVTFEGIVQSISPTIETAGRTFRARVKILNDKQLLKPGMFIRVQLILDEMTNVLIVPAAAIMKSGDGRQLVFVVVDEIAFLRDVQTGINRNEWVVIKKGVKAGEKIVVEGKERLRDLAAVQILETVAQ